VTGAASGASHALSLMTCLIDVTIEIAERRHQLVVSVLGAGMTFKWVPTDSKRRKALLPRMLASIYVSESNSPGKKSAVGGGGGRKLLPAAPSIWKRKKQKGEKHFLKIGFCERPRWTKAGHLDDAWRRLRRNSRRAAGPTAV
jgi:hypothetical protein